MPAHRRPAAAVVLGLVLVLTSQPGLAEEYFVSPDGSDDNPGSRQAPWATLDKAARRLQPADTCYLRRGVYRQVLRPARSGRPGRFITFKNYNGETVVLSGAEPLGPWTNLGGGIYSAPMPWSMPDGNQVFWNDRMLSEACWPDPGPEHLFKPRRAVADGGSADTLQCDRLDGPADAWKGARLWCAGGAAWICWSATVTGYDPANHRLTFDKPQGRWYQPRRGNHFVLRGLRRALTGPGQWWYDRQKQRLLVIPPDRTRPDPPAVQAKRRVDAIDLSGRSWIRIEGLTFQAAGLRTDAESSHIVLKNLKGRYVSHSYEKDVSSRSGVLILGSNILVLNCDLGYSSASVLTVKGRDNRIINNFIHHGGYAGLWRGTVSLAGRRIVFSHNTVRHAGRDLVNTHGLMESLVQYNDVSDAGWLTRDLGLFYGHNTDYANTQFRYNWVHDNHAADCAMGIYFDHLSHNVLVHHNVVWNVGMDPIRINNPAYCNLVFNNTCWNSGPVRTFDHSRRNDLFATRYFNNLFNGPVHLPDHVALENNLILERPKFRDAAAGDYRLAGSGRPSVGAYAPSQRPWKAGCDLDHPPDPLPQYQAPRVPWMNTVRNACFELGSLEGWRRLGRAGAELVEGNGWGNGWGRGPVQPTGTSRYELRLGPGRAGVEQTVTGLSPGTRYQLSAWMKVSDAGQTVVLGVKDAGAGEQAVSVSATQWTRRCVDFKTGPQSRQATIYLLKSTEQKGWAWCDNVVLPLTGPGR